MNIEFEEENELTSHSRCDWVIKFESV
jgi:hypothetical protein